MEKQYFRLFKKSSWPGNICWKDAAQTRLSIRVKMPHRWKSHVMALTLCLLVLSVDNFCKQFGPRVGQTKGQAWSGSKLFDTLLVFMVIFLEEFGFEGNWRATRGLAKLPSRQGVKFLGECAHCWIHVNMMLICTWKISYYRFLFSSMRYSGGGGLLPMYDIVQVFGANSPRFQRLPGIR